MTPRTAARLFGAGRAGIGLLLIWAPSALGRPWIGDVADTPGGQVALRALGIRDLLLGLMAYHVADDPGAGPGMALTCAAADVVDLGATLAVRRGLPPSSWGVAALAAGGAATGLALSAALKQR